MSDYDRGAYTPQSDAPLAFDARQSRGGGGGGGGGPSPMTLIVSGVVLLLLVIALLIFYRSGVRRGDEAPQVVGSPLAQTKAAPPASAQPADPGAGLQVYKTEVAPPSEGKTPPTFVAKPEQPSVRPAPAERETTPASTSVEAPASSAPHLRTAKTETPEATPAAAAKPAKTAPVKVAKAAPAPTAAGPVGGAVVQIGAFSSAALADKGWNDTAGLMPGAMAGKTKKVEFITKNDQPFYRTYVGGFASKLEAQTFCSALKAAGKSCFVK
jgi:cell division protein FtsN